MAEHEAQPLLWFAPQRALGTRVALSFVLLRSFMELWLCLTRTGPPAPPALTDASCVPPRFLETHELLISQASSYSHYMWAMPCSSWINLMKSLCFPSSGIVLMV